MTNAKKTNIVHGLLSRETGLKWKRQSRSTPSHILRGYAESAAAVSTKNEHCEISGQARSTLVMTFSRDGLKIASTHGDHTIRVTNLRNGKCTHVLQGHPRTPWCIAFHPACSDILASGCLAGEVRIWDLKGGGSEIWRSPEGLSVASLAFHPSDNVLVFAIANRLRFWAWKEPNPYHECQTSREYEKIRWVKFDPLGHYLYTGIANSSTITAPDNIILSADRSMNGTGSRFGHGTGSRMPMASSELPLHSGELSHLLTGNATLNEGPSLDISDVNDRIGAYRSLRTRYDRYEQTTAASVASARRYAADVTDHAQRTALGGHRGVFAQQTTGRPLYGADERSTAAASAVDPNRWDVDTVQLVLSRCHRSGKAPTT
jgi:hypothetical protein